MFDLRFLHQLRYAELAALRPELQGSHKVLEFGAGTGSQAKLLTEWGHEVTAVDLAASAYAAERVFPVTDFDGIHLPLPSSSVDVIFSSNVLEHVENLDEVFVEFRRVLRPGGYCVHVMPSVAWRAWTFATGYLDLLPTLMRMVRNSVLPPPGSTRAIAISRGLKGCIGCLVPIGHGTSFEGLSELYTFSAFAWQRRFRKGGFVVKRAYPIGLLHSGHMLAGPALPIGLRQKLSAFLGSAATVYIVEPAIAASGPQ